MATADWSVLGGNPAPGDVAAIEGIAGGARAVMTEVTTDVDELRRIIGAIGQATWHGPAAERFLELLAAAASHLTLMERAHQPVAHALSAHATLLAEQQQQAARALDRAGAAVAQRTEQLARRTAAEDRYSATAGSYERAGNELASIERQITARLQSLEAAAGHLVSDVFSLADATLHSLLGSKQSWEEVRRVASEGMAAAREVVNDADRLVEEAAAALAAAVRMAASIAAEVESSIASARRTISEVDDDLGTVWRHVEQGAVGGFDRWASSVQGELAAVTPGLGEAFHVAVEMGRGVVEGTVGMVAGVAVFEKAMWDISPDRMLIDPSGWMHSVEDVGTGVVAIGEHIEHHPAGFFESFGKRLLNWTTWAHDPAKAFGELLPSIVLTVATAGAGAGVTAVVRTIGDVDNAVGVVKAAEGTTTSVGETAAVTYAGGKVEGAIKSRLVASGLDDDPDAVQTPDVTAPGDVEASDFALD